MINHWTDNKRRFRRGSALLYLAIGLFVLLGLISLGVDVGHAQLAKSELRATLDAATLAGCSGLGVSPAEARKRAKDIALANKVDGRQLVLLDSDIQLGTWDSSTRQFSALSASNESLANSMRIVLKLTKARGNAVQLTFAGMFGVNSIELSATSTAAFATGVDSVIVQDITSSFNSELSNAKKGDQAFLDNLNNSSGAGALGIVAQTGKSKTIAPLQSISGNYTTLSNAISSLKTCGSSGMPACSGTDIAAGIEGGLAVFNAYTSNNMKTMIIVSDGEPTQDSDGQHPSMNAAQLLAQANADADTAWNTYKISVYVVFWNETNDATAAANLATLKRGNGTFISISDPNQLPVALGNIAKSLPTQLVQ
ncbi:MAG TPA: pilus assembly protein TadG-related protein [Tepidisphaeraceae bacterium]|nr:pilus assembly protein TadG-related protein [Tepidisphaeraceae bacterium]